jgi:hypothetical protein
MNYGTIGLIALVIFLLTPLSRIVLAALFGRSIGQAALARQPDTIHLQAADASKLRHAGRIRTLAEEYTRCGFADAGTYAIPEMPGVSVQLLAHQADSMYAAVYDHPVAGVFYDVVSRYPDGSAWTWTTARATGLKHRPNTRMTNLPGTEPAQLIETARRERPAAGLRACTTANAVADFEAAYAEYMAWIKQRGISTSEVVEVARRKVA